MNCPKCNAPLVNHYVCRQCGHEDQLAKKVIYASNWHFNQGLEKARVKDLTGAINSLTMSLKYNKRNIQARNLLGLIYYHMGEMVSALSEWVISVNFQKQDNRANTYIRDVQNNPARLEHENKTIQKYNVALEYLWQGNMDVAIIELKKVININPNYIRAYQLMGLLYIRTKQYAAARKVLVQALKIDRNNITCLRYMDEINKIAGEKATTKTRRRDGFTQINDPNPVVIEEKSDGRYTDFNTGLLSVVNVLIGVVIGAAVVWLLLVPSVKKSQAVKYNQAVVEYSSQISEKNKLITSLNKEVEDLKSANDVLSTQVSGAVSSQEGSSTQQKLLQAIKAYMAEDNTQAGLLLAEVDVDKLSTSDEKDIYETIYLATKDQAISTLYNQGYAYYESGEYMKAIEDLLKVLKMNAESTDAMYYLASAYQKLADLENATLYYQQIVNNYPDSSHAADAQNALNQMQNSNSNTP